MAWSDQCKYAFKTNAEALLWKKRGRERKSKAGIMKVLQDLSDQSGIPRMTLYRWWNELEKEKSFKNETSSDNHASGGNNTESDADKTKDERVNRERPICRKCNERPVHLDGRTGVPVGPLSIYYRLCEPCRRSKMRIRQIDAKAGKDDGVFVVCLKCGNEQYINMDRVKEGKK